MTDAEMSGPGAATERRDPPLPGENPPEGGADARLAELEAKLAAAAADLEKAREDWLRAKAETENVRRRGQEDVTKAHRFGLENFASALLAVKDSLDAALTVENTSIESFKEGVELTARQLEAASRSSPSARSSPRARNSIPTATRPSARSRATRRPGRW